MQFLKATLLISSLLAPLSFAKADTFIKYDDGNNQFYASVIDSKAYPIDGNIYGDHTISNQHIETRSFKSVLPVSPEKVFAVGMNFASHLSSPSDLPPPIFLKLPSSLALTGQKLIMPEDASNVHFEGELVLVIGKEAKNLTESEAKDAIFGVTVGNDLTERNWQGSDLQWLRAKATDGFGPIGNSIVTNIDYNNVLLTTRLNGKIVQQENTRNMIHSPSKVVSYLSHYFTLKPGDLVFMGTPGKTQALSDGDIVEVSIEEVGNVRNTIRF
jgi:2-keto-4-pentenoate hydratase/2-oxohepta-3-ene-1,7-dioic acid hydratase in catechol pathway